MPYKDPQKKRDWEKTWRTANQEKVIENNRVYYETHREELLSQYRVRRQADPEGMREKERQWRAKNLWWVWATNSNSAHRRAGYTVLVEAKDLSEMAAKTPVCHYCGTPLDYARFKGSSRGNSATVDRLNNESVLRADNIQIICLRCNSTKGRKPHAEFTASVGAGA